MRAFPLADPLARLPAPQVIAAHRAGLRTVILPARNEKDLRELPESVITVSDPLSNDRLTLAWFDMYIFKEPGIEKKNLAGKRKKNSRVTFAKVACDSKS